MVIPRWDFSLRLIYAIDIIGKNEIRNIDGESVLNQGSEKWCGDNVEYENVLNSSSPSSYCEFEHLFEEDLIRVLSSSADTIIEKEQIGILFVKPSGMDGIIVSCRFMPPIEIHHQSSFSSWVERRIQKLIELVGSGMMRIGMSNF